jgi:hypothetical protein
MPQLCTVLDRSEYARLFCELCLFDSGGSLVAAIPSSPSPISLPLSPPLTKSKTANFRDERHSETQWGTVSPQSGPLCLSLLPPDFFDPNLNLLIQTTSTAIATHHLEQLVAISVRFSAQRPTRRRRGHGVELSKLGDLQSH